MDQLKSLLPSRRDLAAEVLGGLIVVILLAVVLWIWDWVNPDGAPSIADVLPYLAVFVLGALMIHIMRGCQRGTPARPAPNLPTTQFPTLRTTVATSEDTHVAPLSANSVHLRVVSAYHIDIPWHLMRHELQDGIVNRGFGPPAGPTTAVLSVELRWSMEKTIKDATLTLRSEELLSFITALGGGGEVSSDRRQLTSRCGDLVGNGERVLVVLLARNEIHKSSTMRWHLADGDGTEIRSGTFDAVWGKKRSF